MTAADSPILTAGLDLARDIPLLPVERIREGLCDKSEGQARACPLRAALDGCTVHTLPRYRGCSYRGALVEEGTPWPQPPQNNHEERQESP